ncbi:MAG: AMP-binding protein [Rhodopseudomonas palustris]|nr:AMP-binding protein [Rhodopseudomonas palustris]
MTIFNRLGTQRFRQFTKPSLQARRPIAKSSGSVPLGIRSCSAALPPQVMQDLESTFQTQVIESYGMTEASHQMASNPLAPARRKTGSVGIAAGPDLAVMDEAGLLPAGESEKLSFVG